MSNPTIRIHNIETNEIIDREMTNSEYSQFQAEQELKAARDAEEQSKAEAKEALLARLGITEEEAQLLLGGN